MSQFQVNKMNVAKEKYGYKQYRSLPAFLKRHLKNYLPKKFNALTNTADFVSTSIND